MSLLILNTAAIAADRQVRQSSVSIYTALGEQANKYGVKPYDVATQLIKLFPEYTGLMELMGAVNGQTTARKA